MNDRRWLIAVVLLAIPSMVITEHILAAQQIPDPNFDARVAHPAYVANHPRIAIDQAHKNIHTADGLFKPFADLARNDGYEVVKNTANFARDQLQGTDVLVISNALGNLENDNNDSTPAFTQSECDAVYEWVAKGGSLLLLADHGPLGEANALLAHRFGVSLGDGFVFDNNPGNFDDNDPTELIFSEQNHLLGTHPISRGRDNSERLHKLVAFTGESVSVPRAATAILPLSSTTGEVPTRNAEQVLYVDDPAKARANRETAARQWPVRGRALAIAFPLSHGRVVISGEAGMFTAQVYKKQDGSGALVGQMGMSVPGNDDRQYVLNVLHWLSGLLK
jgi:hypothetical protein